MAQTQILAAGAGPATSTDVVLAAGAIANLAAFRIAPETWRDTRLSVYMDTNGDDAFVAYLNGQKPAITIQGPGTFRVVREQGTTAIGVTSET